MTWIDKKLAERGSRGGGQMATGVTQAEVDLLTARIDDLTRFLVEATTKRDELAAENVELKAGLPCRSVGHAAQGRGMKTAQQWWEQSGSLTGDVSADVVPWIQAIIDDARAGMVDEVELIKAQLRITAIADEWSAKFHAERDQHEAELAKAWEASWRAALEAAAPIASKTIWDSLEAAETSRRILELQPPGGKAK